MRHILHLAHVLLVSIVLLLHCSSVFAQQGTFVDAVVASVNGKPITLREVLAMLPGNPTLTLNEAATDRAFLAALEQSIIEHLVEEDANVKRVSVSEAEVDAYLSEIATRNNMTRTDFEAALTREGLTLSAYKARARFDILRSRLVAQTSRGGVAVSDEEVESYLKDKAKLGQGGTKIKLSHILISNTGRSDEETNQRLNAVKDDLAAGKPFAAAAGEYSESSDAKDGGVLGIFSEQDLDPAIFDAVITLQQGEVSSAVTLKDGLHLFRLDERIAEDGQPSSELKEETRRILQDQKLKEKVAAYFTTELPKLYPVEKKI